MITLRGTKAPLGTHIKDGGVNFAVFSQSPHLSLLLFHPGANEPFLTLPLDPLHNKTGGIWHIFVPNLTLPFEYLYEVIYPEETARVHDPYAKGLSSDSTWGVTKVYQPKGRCFEIPDFDWEGVKKPNIPLKDLIIYEMHLKGFTQDPSSNVPEKGTFLGMIPKIPYLVSLGINAVEFLPVFEFNECEYEYKGLCNFWGYSTVNFFCPMQRYAFGKKPDDPITEFKTLVKELHRNGIAVLLDVVYNHTAEHGDDGGVNLSFKALGKHTYYLLNDEGKYLNFTGTGNTFNCNNPVAAKLIVDSLSYWAEDMQVDGFRFDLASIFTRGEGGAVLGKPPLLELIRKAPALQETLLIAEAWDAAGLYQVGSFPGGGRWSEWNGRYRDTVRKFIKGTDGLVGSFMQSLCGSQDLYGKNTPLQSINFITAHDGYTLNDLVSYQNKQNLANGENNRDGTNDNENWNCGAEGATRNKTILILRNKQMKNFQTALLLSLGVPMILMGDEYGHSKQGNNNTYCQDNKMNFFLWNESEKHPDVFRFMQNLIRLRKEKSALFCRNHFLTEKDVQWISADLKNETQFLAYILNDHEEKKDYLIVFNAGHTPINFSLPDYTEWGLILDTALSPPSDFPDTPDKRPLLSSTYLIAPNSSFVAEAVLAR